MSLELLTPEQRLEFQTKMDAVSLTGVWLPFPKTTTPATHGRVWWAGIYHQLLEEEARKRGTPAARLPNKVRATLLDEVVRRITEADDDDLMLILAG